MAQKFRNPLAQTLGIVLQDMRDKMGGISSFEIASLLGLAASHYRMIEAGSAILQPSRAVKVVQTFETIEFIALCQTLVAIQILDTAKSSADDMRTTTELITEANPRLSKVFEKFDSLWDVITTGQAGDVSRKIVDAGIDKDLHAFLTTESASFSAEEIDNFMSPTYEYPLSGQLYSKIGNILQGVAPFYLDTVLQLIENLKNITPRVTAPELAKWEALHKSRITHIIGIVRKPEIILDVNTFDYTFLWEDNFQKILIIYRDKPKESYESVHKKISQCLKIKFESERLKYERQLENFDETINNKLKIEYLEQKAEKIEDILSYRDMSMNNLWVYIMVSGYVVPFIDNASPDTDAKDIYGTSLAYDETCDKLVEIRKLCSDVGFEL